MQADTRALGRRIAERRRAVGLTQEQLAERAGVNVKSVQGVEQGRTEPELRTIRKIAKVLATSVDALLNVHIDRESVTSEIAADLEKLSPELLGHVAAVVRGLVRRGGLGASRRRAHPAGAARRR